MYVNEFLFFKKLKKIKVQENKKFN
jgi:hypothetical protein